MAKNEDLGHNLNIIGVGTQVEGNIKSTGDVRIDGSLQGNVTTQAKLVLGDTGKIIGDITCKDCEIYGNTKGKIQVENLLMLRATAIVEGDIKTTKLAIEPNAVFIGTCNMGNNNTSIEE